MNLTQSVSNSLIPFWQKISIFFLKQSVWKVMYVSQIRRRESWKWLTNVQCPLYFLAEAIPWFIYIKFCHQVNNRSKYADGLYNSMIEDKDGHIPSPLIMFTCTALSHAPLEWQQNTSVHPKAYKSKLKLDKPNRSNIFNYENGGGKNPLCCTGMGIKLVTLPGISDKDTYMMNTWNTVLESYQQTVYENTLATVKRQIQHAENPIPAVFIRVEAMCVDNSILLHNLTFEVGIEEPAIGCTDPNIPIHNNFI